MYALITSSWGGTLTVQQFNDYSELVTKALETVTHPYDRSPCVIVTPDYALQLSQAKNSGNIEIGNHKISVTDVVEKFTIDGFTDNSNAIHFIESATAEIDAVRESVRNNEERRAKELERKERADLAWLKAKYE